MRGRKPCPPSRSPLMTEPSSNTPPVARPCLGTRSAALGRSWRSPLAKGPRPSPLTWSATPGLCGVPASATGTPAYTGSSKPPNDRAARPGFPPLQRAQIVELACLEPVAKGLHITHWSSEDLARQAVADGIVASISPRTVRLDPGPRRPATAPHTLLADDPPRCPVQGSCREGPLVLRQRRAAGPRGLLGPLRR